MSKMSQTCNLLPVAFGKGSTFFLRDFMKVVVE